MSCRLDRSSSPPLLPSVGGGDLQSVIATIGQVTDAIDSIPFTRIGRMAGRASPKVVQTLVHLDSALVALDSVTSTVRGQVGPMVTQMRQTMEQLRSTARGLNGLMGGTLQGQENLDDMVKEMTRAARPLRELANYLSEHPEALLRGRSKDR